MELRRYRKAAGMTMKALGAAVGCSESAISQYETGKRSPDYEMLLKLAQTLGTTVSALLGEVPEEAPPEGGNVLSLDTAAGVLVRKYYRLNATGRLLLEAQADFLLTRPEFGGEPTAGEPEPPRPMIRLYLHAPAAGYENPVLNEDYVEVPREPDTPREADYCLNISGDSMEPYIRDRQRVYVSRAAQLQDGDVGIFYVSGAMYCKQIVRDGFGNTYLLSANPQRQDANVVLRHDSDVAFRCYGKVLLDRRLPMPHYT